MTEAADQQCTDEGCNVEDCKFCNNLLIHAGFGAYYAAIPMALVAAAYALIWDGSWLPFGVAFGSAIGSWVAVQIPIWSLELEARRLRRGLEQRHEEIRRLQEERHRLLQETHMVRQERIQLELLVSQRKAELASGEAYLSALRAERLEMERLLVQRKVEQEAREARQRLEVACAAIEADRLEAAAWRMEFTAKQLEVKLNQAELFESLSAIEDNAQDRIIAAYEQGFDHGQRGIVVPIKHQRHLRVVEESA